MRARHLNPALSRRAIVRSMAAGAALAAASASPLAAAAAKPAAKATEMPEQGATAALLRTTFPHARLDESFYAGAAAAYLEEIADTPAMAEHRRGLQLLDGSHIAPFTQLPPVIQRSMVAKYDQEPFFKALVWRGAELVYRDHKLWSMVGYEGSSVEYGGYIERGFDDIDWLPSGGGAR